MNKKKATPKVSKKFGLLINQYTEGGKTVKVYRDGNQVYFVKDGKIQQDMTIHIDDIDELIKQLNALADLKDMQDEG